MKPSDQIDIAVPIEYICSLLGLPEDVKGVYHSQKSNTLFIRVSQGDVDNPCVSAVLQKEGDNATVTINEADIQTFGRGYTRHPGTEFRVSRYNTLLSEVWRGIIKYRNE